MKRGGIIDANLAGAIGRLGHTDLLVVFDAGLPMPQSPAVVDLAFWFGVPTARGGSGREHHRCRSGQDPEPERFKTRLPGLN
jgi:hypothetical protein